MALRLTNSLSDWFCLQLCLDFFFVHDIFIHQRFKLFRNAKGFYFKGLRKAHKVHHNYLEKEDGENFGMLIVPFKYFKSGIKKSNSVKKMAKFSLHTDNL